MNTTELTEHLRDATAGLEPPPWLADAVLRGGRRRRARRRLTVTASVLAVVAVATAATVVTLREDTPAPVADARLTQPTKGDLASDQAFLDEARRTWQNDLPTAPEARDRYYDDPRGEPHVYWAGNTPAGRAAIVLQQVYVHPNTQVTEKGLRTAQGLVAIDPADGRLKLVGTRVIGLDPGQADYYKFGPQNRTMLIVDDGAPLHYDLSPSFFDGENGRMAGFEWQRAEPEAGVAVIPIPADVKPGAAIVVEGEEPPGQIALVDVPYVPLLASTFLALRLPDPSYRLRSELLAWGETMWRVGEPLDLTHTELDQRWGFYRYYTGDPDSVVSMWTIAAGLPDGRVIILKESQDGDAPPRLIARVAPNPAATETILVDGGTVDRDAILPVRFQIPDGGGWIVADKGKQLSYRTSPDEAWQDAGRDAALLPENATEILVGDHYVRL